MQRTAVTGDARCACKPFARRQLRARCTYTRRKTTTLVNPIKPAVHRSCRFDGPVKPCELSNPSLLTQCPAGRERRQSPQNRYCTPYACVRRTAFSSCGLSESLHGLQVHSCTLRSGAQIEASLGSKSQNKISCCKFVFTIPASLIEKD